MLAAVFEGFLGLGGDVPVDLGAGLPTDLPADLPVLRREGVSFFTLLGLFFEVFNGNSVCHGLESTIHGEQQVATTASDLLFGEDKFGRFLSNARE